MTMTITIRNPFIPGDQFTILDNDERQHNMGEFILYTITRVTNELVFWRDDDDRERQRSVEGFLRAFSPVTCGGEFAIGNIVRCRARPKTAPLNTGTRVGAYYRVTLAGSAYIHWLDDHGNTKTMGVDDARETFTIIGTPFPGIQRGDHTIMPKGPDHRAIIQQVMEERGFHLSPQQVDSVLSIMDIFGRG